MKKIKLLHSYIAKLRSCKKQFNNLTIKQSTLGFTLIEVLVVISIIGTLASLATFALGSGRNKGNDTKRKADLKAIQTAAVSYYQDHSQFPPDPVTYPGNAFSSDVGGTNWIPGISAYINTLPKDPLQSGILNLLAGLIKQQAVHTTQFLASLLGSQNTQVPQGQVAGVATWTTSYDTTQSDIRSLTYDSVNRVLYAGSGPNGIIYRCATSTGCTSAANWTTSYDTPEGYIFSLTFDSVNGVIYAGSGTNGIIYRCATSTGCTSAANWTTSYDTPETDIRSLTFDSLNGVIYAGTDSNGIIYRCATSTGCTSAANWITSYDTPEIAIPSLAFDSSNGVMYAGAGNDGIIYRCATSTGCTSAANWTTSYDTPEASIYSLTFDSVNRVIYAGTTNNGIIYRCATSTGCTSAANWTVSYDTPESAIYSLAFDSLNKVIYAATGSNGIIYSCDTATGCTSAANWTVSYDTTESIIMSLTFDSINGVIYAGSNSGGIIFRGVVPALTEPNITSCSITPTTLAVGQNVTITATVKNNRATAISTQVPDSGFGYLEAQSFNSLGYAPVPNKFRIGVDNETSNYYWRWGFGPPSTTTLAAGASTTGTIITGTITMGTVGTKTLSIGLVEESIAWRDTNKCPTTVTVGAAIGPTVTTTAATAITSTGATLNGTANPNGQATTGWFRYATASPGTCNDTFGTRYPASGGYNLGLGSTANPYPETIPSGTLTASTTYYFCAIASSGAGTSVGSVLSFATSAPTASANIKANGSNGPITVSTGDSVSITWTSSNTTSCTVSGGPGGSGTSGSFAWTATTNTSFSISCTGGIASDSVTVNVGAVSITTCENKKNIYCYIINTDRSSFVIWAQLDNANDPDLYSKPNAICKLTPPASTFFNYCVESSSL